MKKIVSSSMLIAIGFMAFSQDHTAALNEFMKKAGIPGLSLAYVKKGTITEYYALGVKSTESGIPINDSSIFSAASLSKSIFAYAVFNLVMEKKLDLDKPLYTYYNYTDVVGDPKSKLVTARMILSHSSGLPNWRDDDSLHFIYQPGEKFSYSGEGMVWLSRVVEKITGMPIEIYLKTKIFDPLRMNHTSYVWQKKFAENYALPHIDAGKSMSKYFPTEANVAQSLQTTAVDYGKYLLHILEDKKFMNALKEDRTIPVTEKIGWGLGLGHQLSSDGMSFFQWGDNGTFKGFLIGYPDKKEGLVYFANTFHGLKIAKDILELYFPGDQPALAWLNTDSANTPDLQVFEKTLQSSVAEALSPYLLKSKNIIDTTLISISKINYLGNRFIQLREFEKANDFFKEGLKINAAFDLFYKGLGESYLRSGKLSEARMAFRKAADINPGNAFYQTINSKLAKKIDNLKQNEKLISFRLPEYMNAHFVSLVGTFNGWNDIAEPLWWENGAWKIAIPLSPGTYQYKFVVDGVWLTDIRNPNFKPGSFDSEIIVK